MEKQNKSESELERNKRRSRSPQYRPSNKIPSHRREERRRERSSSSSSYEEIRERHKSSAKPPPPTVKSKISMNLKTASKSGIQLKLSAPATKPVVPPAKASVASAFNDDSDEEEEMPAECKMRMRNIGKATPTSSGPNSFGKTKLGFVDSKKIFEKKMQQMLEQDPI